MTQTFRTNLSQIHYSYNRSRRCCDAIAKITYSEILPSADFRIKSPVASSALTLPAKVLLEDAHGLGQLLICFADRQLTGIICVDGVQCRYRISGRAALYVVERAVTNQIIPQKGMPAA